MDHKIHDLPSYTSMNALLWCICSPSEILPKDTFAERLNGRLQMFPFSLDGGSTILADAQMRRSDFRLVKCVFMNDGNFARPLKLMLRKTSHSYQEALCKEA